MTKMLDIHSKKKWISFTFGEPDFDHEIPDNDNDDPPALPVRSAMALPVFGSTNEMMDGLWRLGKD